MPFWWRNPMEEAFWQDDTTRNVLLTVDRSFWGICLINVLVEIACVPRMAQNGQLPLVASYALSRTAVMCFCLLVAIAVALAIRRDPVLYYRHREAVMFFNRVFRMLSLAVFCRVAFDQELMAKAYVSDRLVAGRHPLLVVFLILIHASGNYLLWALYFPLPFHKGVWLDVIQLGIRLTAVKHCTWLLTQPGLRPTVTSVCTTLNLCIHISASGLLHMHHFDQRCVEDGPLLLSLWSWWFLGTFWPTFTAWYCESLLRKRFMRRHGRGGPDVEDLRSWALIGSYLWTNVAVGAGSWVVLQFLMTPRNNKDWVMWALDAMMARQ